MEFTQLDFWSSVQQPGDWVETHGKELSFDEITQRIGSLIVMDMSTVSHAWYKIVQVEKIVEQDGTRRLVYYDGHKQRGYVGEYFFPPIYTGPHPARAYEVA